MEAGVAAVDYEAGDCYAASYGSAMSVAGLEPVVLGGQWGVSWTPDARLALGSICLDPLDWHSAIRLWYDVEIVRLEHQDAETVLRHLAQPGSCPAIVPLDSFYLHFTSTYRRQHYPHALLVLAVTPGGVEVVDAYRGYRFSGVVDLQILRAAVASEFAQGLGSMSLLTCRHRPAKPGCVPTVRIDNRAPGQQPESDEVLAQLRRDLDFPDTSPTGGIVGPAAIAAIGAELHRCADRVFDDAVMLELLSLLGSLASQRGLNADFLDWATATGLDLVDAAEAARSSSRSWMTLRNLVFLRGGRGQVAEPALLHRVADRIVTLADAERELYAAVRAVV